MKRLIIVIFASVFLLLPAMAAAQSFEFPVERERMFRNHRGTLIILFQTGQPASINEVEKP
jgi:hypothetical protein